MDYPSLSLAAYDARRPWHSHQWCRYFRRNGRELLEVPWDAETTLTGDDRAVVADSIREFQLGESAQGRHFVRAAKAYAVQSGDLDYVAAVRLFIAEEQRHARQLGQFLEREGIPLAQRSWTDAAFRWLRKRAGLEVCIVVLVTAEIIAKVYYAALREATASPVLRRICDQILHDEAEHVRFQAERLSLVRARRIWPLVSLTHAVQRALFAGACLVVWHKHHPVLRAGGYSFTGFWQSGWREMREALSQMTPRPAAVGAGTNRGRMTTAAGS